MDLHQLRLFTHVYDAGSLSAAAERSRLAVSAVSLHLSNLEAELGVTLFQRLARGMRPTAAGERLILHARTILAAVETAQAELAGAETPVTGRLRLGMASSAVTAFGGPLLQAMARQFPHVDLSISDSVASDRIADLLDGTLDLAIAFNPQAHRLLDTRPLLRERLYCIGRREIVADSGRPITLPEVLDLPLVLPRPADGMRALTGDHAWLRRIEARNCLHPGSGLAIREAVFQGLGATIGSPMLLLNDVRANGLSVRPITEPDLWRTLCLCGHRQQKETAAKEACRAVVLDLVDRLTASGQWIGAVPV